VKEPMKVAPTNVWIHASIPAKPLQMLVLRPQPHLRELPGPITLMRTLLTHEAEKEVVIVGNTGASPSCSSGISAPGLFEDVPEVGGNAEQRRASTDSRGALPPSQHPCGRANCSRRYKSRQAARR
jgi:hypothetical protein